jgi:hypothetical protein
VVAIAAEPARIVAASDLAPLFGEYRISVPPVRLEARRCIATVVSAPYVRFADRLLGSLRAHGGCADASLVVFVPDGDAACAAVAARHGAKAVPFGPAAVAPTVKGLLYSVARAVEAEEYLCMDADMMVLDSLAPVFERLATARRRVLLCREAGFAATLGQAVNGAGDGSGEGLDALDAGDVAGYPLVVNDGLFAGQRDALLALDASIREMTAAPRWVGRGELARRRAELVLNTALAKLDCADEIDRRYNVQLGAQSVLRRVVNGRVEAQLHGCRVAVLHFDGAGRRQFDAWRTDERAPIVAAARV